MSRRNLIRLRNTRWSRDQTITSLIELLTEDQIIEYANSFGRLASSSLTPGNSLLEQLEAAANTDLNNRLPVMQGILTSFLYERKMPHRAGLQFQRQVYDWLNQQGYEVKNGEHIRGTLTSPQYYDVDVHAEKNYGFLHGNKHIWVEVKAHRVNKPVLVELEAKATDVHHAKHLNRVDWAPDILMVVSF